MAPSSTPRDRLVAWLRWYMKTHPSVVPTQAALARRLGLSKSAVSEMLAPGTHSSPSCEVLVAARELTGLPVDALLLGEPPEVEQPSLPLTAPGRRRA
jgi:transcriptional regulator with XRE-family HTH domain